VLHQHALFHELSRDLVPRSSLLPAFKVLVMDAYPDTHLESEGGEAAPFKGNETYFINDPRGLTVRMGGVNCSS
jgi:hypothetical protein